MKRGINIFIDGQWGSTGKGKFVGYMALSQNIDGAVCNFMTNAGHTYVDENGNDLMFQHIPVSAVREGIPLFLSATCGITLDLMMEEVSRIESFGLKITDRLFIDRHAIVIDKQFIDQEKSGVKEIASTMKGCGFALAEKIKRRGMVRLAKDVPELRPYIVDVSYQLNKLLRKGAVIIGETAQGFDLSLNHGHSYPYVTSRDVTPMQFLNDCGVHHHYCGDVFGIIRTFPIRVGNVVEDGKTVGTSGGYYPDQTELDWGTISALSGKQVKEYTSVTKRVRRIFTFSKTQYEKFLTVCRPTRLMINFINYFDGINDNSDLSEVLSNEQFIRFMSILSEAEKKTGVSPELTALGTGRKNDDIILIPFDKLTGSELQLFPEITE